jgi:hypothetical protein
MVFCSLLCYHLEVCASLEKGFGCFAFGKDSHISTLRRAVEAMGGSLTLVAHFPDRKPVSIAGIATIGAEPLLHLDKGTRRS